MAKAPKSAQKDRAAQIEDRLRATIARAVSERLKAAGAQSATAGR